MWGITEDVVLAATDNIDFYNILTKLSPGRTLSKLKYFFKSQLWIYNFVLEFFHKHIFPDEVDDKIDRIMNNQVKDALGLNVTFGKQANEVFYTLAEDFMKPVTDIGTNFKPVDQYNENFLFQLKVFWIQQKL